MKHSSSLSSLFKSPSLRHAEQHRLGRLLIALVIVSLTVFSQTGLADSTASAPANSITISDVHVGFQNIYKVGESFPVRFRVTGPVGTTITPVIKTADPDGSGTLYPQAEVQLTGEPMDLFAVARSGRLEGTVQILIFPKGPFTGATPLSQVTIRPAPEGPLTALRQSSQLWLTLRPEPLLKQGFEQWQAHRAKVLRLVESSDFDQTLQSAIALESVDVIVLNGAAPLSETHSNSIRDWVKNGGKLLISIGDTVPDLQESQLAKWLPALPTNSVDISKLNPLHDMVPRSSSLRTLTTLPGGLLRRDRGAIIANGITEPMAVRYGYGLGQVTLLAVSLDATPLLNWEPESQGALATALAGMPNPMSGIEDASTRSESSAELNPSSVTDLQIQLNHSLDQFKNLKRSSHWQVIGWVALFVLIVGPLDYWIVTKLLKRPEFTWITTILWSVLFASYALNTSAAANQSERVSKQIDIVDLDTGSQTVTSHSWFGFYNQDMQRTLVHAKPDVKFLKVAIPETDLQSSLGWINRPTEGFRGMYRSGGIDVSQPEYEFTADSSTIANMPLRQWSSGTAEFHWENRGTVELPIIHDLQETGSNRLGAGSITHHLDSELTDWFIAYKSFVYFKRVEAGALNTLAPGETFELGTAGSSLLKGWLAGRIEQENASSDRMLTESEMTRLAYDKDSSNPYSIGLTMSFYEILGGESFTKLQNQSLARLDVSRQVSMNNAVLFGRVKTPSAQLIVGGSETLPEQQATLIRIVLPVAPSNRSPDAPPTRDVLEIRR